MMWIARTEVQMALTLAALSICSRSAQAQCTYSVESWPSWVCGIGNPALHTAAGLNNLGAWCGHRLMCYPGEGWLPIYCPPNGTPQVLPMPPGASSWGAKATGVNDGGVVVGFFRPTPNGSEEIGCIWYPDGTITVIAPVVGATTSRANAINNDQVVVGASAALPYVWNAGAIESIANPGVGPGGSAIEISDSGFVVGNFGAPGQSSARAFRWHGGVTEILEPLPGFLSSFVRGVNNNGDVVGASMSYVGGSVGYLQVPTVWRTAGPEPIALMSGFTTGGCFSVNDAGTVTGFVQPRGTSTGGTLYVVWINGDIFKVNDLTVPGSPLIGEPRSVNNAGQLLNSGSARVLTPLGQSFADVNGDCAVDGADIAKLLGEWGPREWSIADLDSDGVVDGRDLGLMLGEWSPASK